MPAVRSSNFRISGPFGVLRWSCLVNEVRLPSSSIIGLFGSLAWVSRLIWMSRAFGPKGSGKLIHFGFRGVVPGRPRSTAK